MMTLQQKIIVALVLALLASLGANAFMAGMLMGARGQGAGVAAGAGSPADRELADRDRMLRERLSEADRKVVREVMEQTRPQIKEAREKMKQARAELDAALAENPQDAARVEAAQRDIESARQTLAGIMSTSKQAMDDRLSQEGRRALEELRAKRGGEWRERRPRLQRQEIP